LFIGISWHDDAFDCHTAAVHLIFKPNDWWPGEMPTQSMLRGSAPYDLIR
jgi:hypothetical protein